MFGLCKQDLYPSHKNVFGSVLRAFYGTDFSPFVFLGILVGWSYKYDK